MAGRTEPFADASVAAVFESYPTKVRRRLMTLRRLIFETARKTEGVGPLQETLKWGEPAYLTSKSKSGTTIRIHWKQKSPDTYGMFVNCQTSLIDDYRTLFPHELTFEGNRAIVLPVHEDAPLEALRLCIEAALTYHLRKKG